MADSVDAGGHRNGLQGVAVVESIVANGCDVLSQGDGQQLVAVLELARLQLPHVVAHRGLPEFGKSTEGCTPALVVTAQVSRFYGAVGEDGVASPVPDLQGIVTVGEGGLLQACVAETPFADGVNAGGNGNLGEVVAVVEGIALDDFCVLRQGGTLEPLAIAEGISTDGGDAGGHGDGLQGVAVVESIVANGGDVLSQ